MNFINILVEKGIVKNFGKIIISKNAEHWAEERPDSWLFRDHFPDYGENITIRDKYELYRAVLAG